ncbi:MAG TPA: (5-formylfuran-3-yl)methyl phosphate synthase [Gemmatimonadales bacterium]|nr:(5-formylfuran-3-yl)methyl phosphate synthase [Gemmatimonadales bacterium]
MTLLLASVRTITEARMALAGGADILDLKEPSAGALGAVAVDVAADVVRFVDGRVPVSATVGDLPMQPLLLAPAIAEMAATGVSFVKVGLFGGGPFDPCLDALARAARAGVRVVAVLFADQRPDLSRLDRIAAAGLRGVMLDTADKRSGGLRTHAADEDLARFVRAARAAGLFAGLAGSLTPSDIPPLLRLGPDYLGFRGALCSGGVRGSVLDPGSLADVRRRIPRPALALS